MCFETVLDWTGLDILLLLSLLFLLLECWVEYGNAWR